MRNLIVRFFYALFVRPILTLLIGVRFENTEPLRDMDQFIIVANHNSHFDAVAMMAALPYNKLSKTHVVAAADYFGKNFFTRALMKLIFNSTLISRKKQEGEPNAIEILDQHLKEGKSLILFPEGSRGKPGIITDFKKGIAILLQKNPHVPFVPAYLDGFGRVLPKDTMLIVPMICKVRFGSPIEIETEDIDSILDMVKDSITSLKKLDERDRNHFLYE